ncbi:GntR family transcriptional regulator [Pseudorhizobium tarimense]|nr:GntR family transcriptional regulator [Pseudorhizobium tarimense]MCJ8521437.1 GntR family transcriptional regulator [Pseudorhizobium tarimense]
MSIVSQAPPAAQISPTNRLASAIADVGELAAVSSTPLWLQLKHKLRDLSSFHLEPGDRLPSEAELCGIFKVSRVTVRQAITALVDEGILERQQGRGTFVCPPRIPETIGQQDHFLLGQFEQEDAGTVSLNGAETVLAADWIAQRLGLQPHAKVHKIRKVFVQDGKPVAIKTSFVPEALVPDLMEYNLLPPLYGLLEGRFKYRPVIARETIEFIIADDFRAGILATDVGHPLMLVERVVTLDTGAAIELSRTYYDALKFRFERHISRFPSGG